MRLDLIILTWRDSSDLAWVCKALWTRCLFREKSCWASGLCNTFCSFWRVVSGTEAVVRLLRSLFTNLEAFYITQEVFATIILTWRNSFNLASVGKALRTGWFLRENNNRCLLLCKTFSSLRWIMSWTDSFSSFLWSFLANCESLNIISELQGWIISSRACCTDLSSICKIIWPAVGLSASNINLWCLRFGKWVSFLWIIFTGSNTII